jgi:membrane protein implicated in regulation of membrane protease activity
MLGGLVFGIATLRAGILPRWAAGLLAVAAALTPLAALVPHEFQRLAGMPVGVALAWLGYALWPERREPASEAVPARGRPSSAKPEQFADHQHQPLGSADGVTPRGRRDT